MRNSQFQQGKLSVSFSATVGSLWDAFCLYALYAVYPHTLCYLFSLTVKVLPLPGSLFTDTLPPCFSAMVLT